MDDKRDKPLAMDKTLNVVYQRKKLHRDVPVCRETLRFDPQCREIIRDIAEQSLRKKIETMRSEYERADDKKNLEFSQLVKAVDRAHTLESSVTHIFLDKVESTIKCFDVDIGKYRKIYDKVMQNLPPSLSTTVRRT